MMCLRAEGTAAAAVAAGNGSSSNKLVSGELTMDAIGGQTTSPIRKNFIDIDSVEWASEAILALADKGIVNGKEEQVFKPMTRLRAKNL